MIKWYQFVLKEKYNPKHYFSRFNTKLDYLNFKKKNWQDQLNISFKASESYRSKNKFFKSYYKGDFKEYVEYVKKNIKKNKKILSIGSGRGISELKLLDLGYNITISDLEAPAGLSQLRKNFKKIKFLRFNILKNKIKQRYDVIICFNLTYAFDNSTLNKFFKNCDKILNQDGIILLSPGSSTLNLWKVFYDKIYLPAEVFFLYFISIFKKKKFEVIKFHHGYIYSDNEIITIAKKNNFLKYKEIFRGDFLSEFNRSLIISKIIVKNVIMKKIFYIFGKKIPFVNIFYFKKKL